MSDVRMIDKLRQMIAAWRSLDYAKADAAAKFEASRNECSGFEHSELLAAGFAMASMVVSHKDPDKTLENLDHILIAVAPLVRSLRGPSSSGRDAAVTIAESLMSRTVGAPAVSVAVAAITDKALSISGLEADGGWSAAITLVWLRRIADLVAAYQASPTPASHREIEDTIIMATTRIQHTIELALGLIAFQDEYGRTGYR